MIGPALTFLGISAYWERAIQGAIILAAVAIDAVRGRAGRYAGKLAAQRRIGRWRERWFPNGEWVLLLALALEIAIFAAIGENFFTVGNFFEVIRLSVELGLLALALTPVIDHRRHRSFGRLDDGAGRGGASARPGATGDCPIPAAALFALLLGSAGGALNALLITRLNIPPLIVTLGSFSMFRGIAEGITHGAVNYSDFPAVVPVPRPGLPVAAWCRCSFRSSCSRSPATRFCCTAR